jgi:uncharacterized delta-60 repeat protein
MSLDFRRFPAVFVACLLLVTAGIWFFAAQSVTPPSSESEANGRNAAGNGAIATSHGAAGMPAPPPAKAGAKPAAANAPGSQAARPSGVLTQRPAARLPLAKLSGAPRRPVLPLVMPADYRGPDGGAIKDFVLALDEVWVPDAQGGGELRKVQAVDRAELEAVLAAWPPGQGGPPQAVMYEAGQPRDETSRRLVTPDLLVLAGGDSNTAALAAAAGAIRAERPPYAPQFLLLRTSGGLAALRAAETLRAAGTEGVELQLASWKAKRAMPDDPLVAQQWHLKYDSQAGAVAGSDINVETAWSYPVPGEGIRGRGIRIGIIDDGVQTGHPDLATNIDTEPTHFDWNGNDPDPNPAGDDAHGTACAGDAAAVGNNALGVSGSAPEAILVGLRLLGGGFSDAMEAGAFNHRSDVIEIKSNSWGPFDDGARLEGPGTLAAAALANAIATGRGGLGTIFLWAGGNGYENYDNSNYDGYANSVYTIAVGASDSQLNRSWYSEEGANLHVCSPSSGEVLGKTTTDLTGAAGYASGDYTDDFGGTSSATPTAAGAVALMLEANPGLGWRDVQEILMKSARQINPNLPGWSTTAAGINHHHAFGAGLVDATAAVGLAKAWENLGPQIVREQSLTGINQPIPDNNPAGVTRQFVFPTDDNVRLEHVTLTLVARHTYRGDLVVTVTSPSGIVSRLAEEHDDGGDNYNWTFSSVRHWGDTSAGVWTVNVSDRLAGDTGILDALTLRVYGTAADPVDPPPSVQLTSPADGTVVTPGGTVLLSATASDLNLGGEPSPVVLVEFLAQLDGEDLPVVVHSATAEPFEFLWSPAEGIYTVWARATDAASLVGESSRVRLEVRDPLPGEVDLNFVPPKADNHVQALASDPEGRIYLGGLFGKLTTEPPAGAPVEWVAPRVARLLSDGTFDPTFQPGSGPDAQVRVLLHVPEDQGLYVGGHFSKFDGAARRALVRLRTGVSDGSLDPGFAPVFEGASAASPPYVRALLRQPDGKILVGGFFTKVNGVNRANLVRLHPDGRLDADFAPEPGGAVYVLALQPDGKILAGGAFTRMGGQTAQRLARLQPNGALDESFDSGSGTDSGFDGPVNSIAVMPDGHVFAGGQFSRYNGRSFYNNMAKLRSNGSVDGRFNFTPGLDGAVNDLHVRPDGEILASGLFTQVANNVLGLPATAAGRVLQFDRSLVGGLDDKFAAGTGANGPVLDSITTEAGQIILAGGFTAFNGVPRARLVALAGSSAGAPAPAFVSVRAGADFAQNFGVAGRGASVRQAIEWVNRPAGAPAGLPRGLRFENGRLVGIPLDAGRYEFDISAVATGSGRQQTSRFVLAVAEAKVPYSQWQRAWFSPLELADARASGPAAVWNAAGLSNFMVYALGGGDPASPDFAARPVVQREIIDGRAHLTLTAPKYAGAQAVYRAEYSTDLVHWGSAATGDVAIVADDARQLKVRAVRPATDAHRQFLRLKVLQP